MFRGFLHDAGSGEKTCCKQSISGLSTHVGVDLSLGHIGSLRTGETNIVTVTLIPKPNTQLQPGQFCGLVAVCKGVLELRQPRLQQAGSRLSDAQEPSTRTSKGFWAKGCKGLGLRVIPASCGLSPSCGSGEC